MSALPNTPDTAPADPLTKRERRKEARPGELLEAALDLFVEKGFAGTKVEEVAARAGVSKGTLFLYFASKEDLFKAVVIDSIGNRFVEWNAEFVTFPGNTTELLKYAMSSWWERVGATKASGITKLMMSEARNFPELANFYQREVMEPGRQLIRKILQRGIDRGEFRPLDLDNAVFSCIAPMIFLMMWKHSMAPCSQGVQIDPVAYLASQVDVMLHGVLAPPEPSKIAG